jgi:hypothetical protein
MMDTSDKDKDQVGEDQEDVKKHEKGSGKESSNDEEPSSLRRRVGAQTTDNLQITTTTSGNTNSTKNNTNSYESNISETVTAESTSTSTSSSKSPPKLNSNKVAEYESEFLNRLKQLSAQQLTFKLKAYAVLL